MTEALIRTSRQLAAIHAFRTLFSGNHHLLVLSPRTLVQGPPQTSLPACSPLCSTPRAAGTDTANRSCTISTPTPSGACSAPAHSAAGRSGDPRSALSSSSHAYSSPLSTVSACGIRTSTTFSAQRLLLSLKSRLRYRLNVRRLASRTGSRKTRARRDHRTGKIGRNRLCSSSIMKQRWPCPSTMLWIHLLVAKNTCG